jgi:hypothetical protein
MCTVLHAIVAAALSLLSGSSAPRCSAPQSTGARRGPQLVWLYLVGSAGRATPAFYVARCAGIAAALGLVPALMLPSQIAKACIRLGSKKVSNLARTDDSTDPLPISTTLPLLSARRFGLRKPAQVWTDAPAPLLLLDPARKGKGTGERFGAQPLLRCRSAPSESPRCC